MEIKKMPLLQGSYSPAQALEMLSKMIKNEQQFHRLQNFISLVRYEGNCEQATQNIHYLCQAQEELDSLVAKAKAENLNIQIEASLRLSLIEELVINRKQVACPSL